MFVADVYFRCFFIGTSLDFYRHLLYIAASSTDILVVECGAWILVSTSFHFWLICLWQGPAEMGSKIYSAGGQWSVVYRRVQNMTSHTYRRGWDVRISIYVFTIVYFFLKIYSDTSQIYVWVVLFDALQRLHGRSELLGFRIYIGTETEASVTTLAVNVAS